MTATLFCGAAQASSNSVPDWVRDAAHQTLPKYPDNTKAVVLLEETTYTVDKTGRATEHVRKVVKILRPQGREEGVPSVAFDKDSKVLSMHVWAIDAAGHEITMKDDQIIEVGMPGEGGELYDDERFRVADAPGRDPGGVVAWEYERRERPYLAETTWEFQDDLPRVKQSFTLVLPEGFTQTTTWAHHAVDKGIDLENQHWRWEMNNTPAIDLDHVPMSPSYGALAGRMTVHYAGATLAEPQEGTWQGIGEWYDALSRGRMNPTPEITAKAAELTAGKTDFYDKAEAIGEFVQQHIRYFVIEMGVGGYQPHPAGEIFHDRYGDCKDKATLLSAMLSSVGIHSALLMVDTERGVVDPAAPSILGNHMIGAIEIPAGYESPKMRSVVTANTGKRYLIFDPTWERTPFGQLEHGLQGSYGVLMEGNKSQVIQLPIMPPTLNTLQRSATFTLSADGTLAGSVTDTRFGDVADRRRYVFTHDDAREQQKFMDKIVDEDIAAASVTGVTLLNVTNLNKDLTTTYNVTAPNFGTLMGTLMLVRPRVLGSYTPDVDDKRRTVPIDLTETMRGTDVYDIKLPAGYTVDELPDPVKIDVGFASYESSAVMHGDTLHYARTFTVRDLTLPASKYAELQHLAQVIHADEDSKAVLKKTN